MVRERVKLVEVGEIAMVVDGVVDGVGGWRGWLW